MTSNSTSNDERRSRREADSRARQSDGYRRSDASRAGSRTGDASVRRRTSVQGSSRRATGAASAQRRGGARTRDAELIDGRPPRASRASSQRRSDGDVSYARESARDSMRDSVREGGRSESARRSSYSSRSSSRASADDSPHYAYGEAPWHGAFRGQSVSQSASPLERVRSAVGSLPGPIAIVPVLAVIAIIAVVVLLVGSLQSCASASAEDQNQQQEAPQPLSIDYTPSIQAFDNLQDPGTTVTGFTLAAEGANYQPSLDEGNSAQIQSALDGLAGEGRTVGFVFVDLESGSGYAYNIDAKVYGASSFKGPVFIYGCQQSLETGTLSINTVDSLCANTIEWSDNTSYYRMRRYFEDYGSQSIETWLSNMNISTTLAHDTSFPHYAARDSIKLWMNTYLYLESDQSNEDVVSWAKNLLSSTEISMIRAGVDPSASSCLGSADDSENEDAADPTKTGSFSSRVNAVAEKAATPKVTVYDKAGWIGGTSDNAICDAGIIVEADGGAYLISVMTNAADTNTNRSAVANLVSALWGARETLQPAEGMVAVATSGSGSGSSDNASSDGGSDEGGSGNSASA